MTVSEDGYSSFFYPSCGDFQLALREFHLSLINWREFLQQLQKRGLEGVQLIVSEPLRTTSCQKSCLSFSALATLSVSPEPECSAIRPPDPTNVPPSPTDIRDIFKPRLEAKLRRCFGPESSNTTTATRSWPIGWRPICRKALRSFGTCRRSLAAHSHQQRAGEPKPSDSPAYPKVVGIFPNTESALRLITAVVEEIHEDWLIGKQYLSLVDPSNHRRIRSQITLSQITEK